VIDSTRRVAGWIANSKAICLLVMNNNLSIHASNLVRIQI
jgi:hypothetical protein